MLEFIRGPMRSWFETQAGAIEDIARAAAELPYYAKGIAAIEAGVADLRLVEVARNAPIPDEFAKDEELRNTYYASLDQWLDPARTVAETRPSSASRSSRSSLLHDERLDRAGLLVAYVRGATHRRSRCAAASAAPPGAPICARGAPRGSPPTLYAGLLLDEAAATRPATLRQLLNHGLPLPQRIAMRTLPTSPEVRELYARGSLSLGAPTLGPEL